MEAHQKCPVCMDIPEKEIYQCVGGHTICHNCITKLKTCPTCREPYGAKKIRNRVLEQILDTQTFFCSHVERGCKEKLKRQDISKHAIVCPQQTIFLCKQVGYQSCNFQVHPPFEDRKRIIKHFKQRHSAQISPTNRVILWHADFNIATEGSQDKNWNPILLAVDTEWCKESIFMIIGSIDSKRKVAFWRCIQICGAIGPNFQADFSLLDTEAKIPCFKWVLPVSHLNSGTQKLGVKYVEIPLADITTLVGKINKVPICVGVRCSNEIEKSGPSKKSMEVTTYTSELVNTVTVSGDNKREVHPSAECSCCEQRPIVGKRHKCLECDYYDLCENCMAVNVHDYHIFATISTPEQGQLLQRVFPQICSRLQSASITAGV